MQSFAQVSEIASKEFEKIGVQHFTNLREKMEAEMGVAFIRRFSTIQ